MTPHTVAAKIELMFSLRKLRKLLPDETQSEQVFWGTEDIALIGLLRVGSFRVVE